ncbi:hypothetical protein GEMRC1_004109 [Eukaryota sp. GEM-RC1]
MTSDKQVCCAVSGELLSSIEAPFFAHRKDMKNPEDYRILLTRDELAFGTRALAAQLNQDYEGQEVVILPVLNGAPWFAVDLSRELNFPVTFHFISASSYGVNRHSCGEVTTDLSNLVNKDFRNKKILIVDELFDSGKTISVLKQNLISQFEIPAEHVKSVTLMSTSKPTSQDPADYCFFVKFTNMWLLGYGLDDKGLYRNFPHVLVYYPPDKERAELDQRFLNSRRRILDCFH